MQRTTALVAVMALIVVNLVLGYYLFRGGDEPEQSAVEAPTTPAASGSAQVEPTGPVRFELGRGNVLLRIQRGSCTGTGRPVVNISRDQGGRFSELALPVIGEGSEVVSTVLGAATEGPEDIQLIVGDENCTVTSYRSTDVGETWEEVEVPAAWYVEADGTTLVAPTGVETTPGCQINSITPNGEINVKVLCSNGQVLGTNDTGTTWVILGELPGGVAATFFGLRNGFGVAPGPDCPSQVYSTADAGGSWTPVGCIDGAERIQALVGGSTRLIATNDETAWFSTDGGVTWQESVPLDEEEQVELDEQSDDAPEDEAA